MHFRSANTSRNLTPTFIVTVSAALFAVLMIAVRLQWAPLESVDHGATADANGLISGQHLAVSIFKSLTLLGSTVVLTGIVVVAAIYLAIRREWRLTAYLALAGAGALVLNPVFKALVGRLRPVVAHPIAHGTGNSFPSGHSLGSVVCYGALLLVFLPIARGRWRTAFIAVVVIVVALIGLSRVMLGVHFVSDVIGGWAIGVTWLGVTTVAFELRRLAAGQPVTQPVKEGLEPQERGELEPAEPEPPGTDPSGRSRGAVAAGLTVAFVLITGLIIGIGELITKYGGGNVLGDHTIPHWFARHRTHGLTSWSLLFTTLGGIPGVVAGSVVVAIIFLAITRRWRPVIYIVTIMIGEVAGFLISAAVVKRPRPDVSHLDKHLPTSAYPSGHVAATCCLYVALAILVIGHARGWWRWLFLVPAVAMPVLVALSRIYRGEHHPTDVLAGMLFAGLWLTVVTAMVKPNVDAARPRPALYRRAHGRSASAKRSVHASH